MTAFAATERAKLVAFLHESGWSCQDGMWQHAEASGQSNFQSALLRLGRQLGTGTEVPVLEDDAGFSVGLMSDAGEANLVEHFADIDEAEAYAKWLAVSFGVPWSHAK
jgi:hypothetical protein